MPTASWRAGTPDASKQPDAETRFQDMAEVHTALIDTGRRAACGDIALRMPVVGAAGRTTLQSRQREVHPPPRACAQAGTCG